jgi:hypothetical protein
MNRILTGVFVAALNVVWLPLPSQAVAIIPLYVNGADQTWDPVRQGVVQQAIDDWQTKILDNQTINITFDFTNAGTSGYLAAWAGSFSVPLGTDVYPWTSGVTQTIHFNADYFSGTHYTWWDPTPTTSNDLPPAAWDALSVARHELGHGLGFVPYFYKDNLFAPGEIDKWTSHITGTTFDPGGLNVSMASSTNLAHVLNSGSMAGDLMVPALVNGARRDISTTDVSMLHLAYGYQVPEPSTLVLLATAAVCVLAYARHRRRP